jgi:hypothetical protein
LDGEQRLDAPRGDVGQSDPAKCGEDVSAEMTAVLGTGRRCQRGEVLLVLLDELAEGQSPA